MNTALFRAALPATACALLLWAGLASAAVVTISSAWVEARVPGWIDATSATAVPANLALTAFSSFGHSNTGIAYTSVADAASLSFTSNYARNPGAPSASVLFNQSSAWLRFTVGQASTYDLSGLMAVNDLVSGAGPTYGTSSFAAYLLDVTDAATATLLDTTRTQTGIEDPSFVFGQGGNLTGSLTGALLAGRTYEFQYRSRMETPQSLPYGAMSAFSNVTLRIAAADVPPATPLPVPGTLALVLAAALGLGLTRRRR